MKLTQAARAALQARMDYLRNNRDRLICDSDTHISDPRILSPEMSTRLAKEPNYYHGRPITSEELLLEMELAGIDVSLCWQNPAATPYSGDPELDYQTLLAANRYIASAAKKYPQRLMPAGWTDPRALGVDAAVNLVETCVTEFGFSVVKLNPAQNQFQIDSREVFTVVERIVALGAVPAFHFGADTQFTPADGLGRVASTFSQSPVIGVHMGGGGASYLDAEALYAQARTLGLAHPNIHFALSARRDTHMESDFIAYQMAGEPYCRNLSCASDAPYGKQSWNYGGFRLMLESLTRSDLHPDARIRSNPGLFDGEAIQNYLGRNLTDLIVASCRKVLENNE